MSSICQRYAFEAIHNSDFRFMASALDVFNMPKIRFWSNSQLSCVTRAATSRCLQYAKDTLLKQFTTRMRNPCQPSRMSSICQRYAFEAIHNIMRLRIWNPSDVFNMPKIRFWSNSQLVLRHEVHVRRCLQYAKDTLLKQFTTFSVRGCQPPPMSSICQRYAFEAIHNSGRYACRVEIDVFNMPKIRFWSNSQQ